MANEEVSKCDEITVLHSVEHFLQISSCVSFNVLSAFPSTFSLRFLQRSPCVSFNVLLNSYALQGTHIHFCHMKYNTNEVISSSFYRFSLFADLFHDAVKNGLQAIQVPGLFRTARKDVPLLT